MWTTIQIIIAMLACQSVYAGPVKTVGQVLKAGATHSNHTPSKILTLADRSRATRVSDDLLHISKPDGSEFGLEMPYRNDSPLEPAKLYTTSSGPNPSYQVMQRDQNGGLTQVLWNNDGSLTWAIVSSGSDKGLHYDIVRLNSGHYSFHVESTASGKVGRNFDLVPGEDEVITSIGKFDLDSRTIQISGRSRRTGEAFKRTAGLEEVKSSKSAAGSTEFPEASGVQ